MGASGLAKLAGIEESFRLLLETVPDAMVITRRDGRIALVNAQTETLFGYSREELLGRKIEELMPKRFRRGHVKHRSDYVAHPRFRPMGKDLELYGQRKDGTEFPVEISLSFMKLDADALVSCAIRDITESKRAEELASHLAAIVDASDDAIIGTDIDGTIISWNTGAEKTYGYKSEEILGQPISVLVPPGRSNELPEIMMRLRGGEHIQKYETTRIHKDGQPVDVSLTISPVMGKGGVLVGASVVSRDITEQKKAREALRLSEERFRVALKNSPVAVFSHDLQLRYTWMSSLNPNVAMADENYYLGRTDAEIFTGEDAARLTAIKEEVLRWGMDSHVEVTITFSGERHYFDLVIEPVRDPEGKIVGLLCSAIDVTSSKETILRLQEALNQVQLLSGLLPICASCKKIKDDHETWQPLESYIQLHSEAKFSHGVCPDCLRKLPP